MSLVAHYTFDDHVNDISGNGNNGTLVGTDYSYTNGKIGKCIHFNATSRITTPVKLMDSTGSPFSVSFWFKKYTNWSVSIAPVGERGSYTWMFYRNNTWAVGQLSFLVYYYTDLGVYTSDHCYTGSIFELNTWYNIILTLNRNKRAVYVNGVLINSRTLAWSSYRVEAYTVGIGSQSSHSASSIMQDADIDDVKLYDHELSNKEIKELYRAKVLHYKFNDYQEPTTNLLYDSGVKNWSISNLSGGVVSLSDVEENKKWKITCTTAGYFRFYVPLAKLTNNYTYTLSMKVKTLSGGPNFYMNDWCDTTLTNTELNDYGTYKFISGTGVRSTYDATYRFMDFVISVGEYEIWDVQFENKEYSTPFTYNNRLGEIKDYSDYKNNLTLPTNITCPKCDTNSKFGNYCYKFDGVNDFISNNSFNYINTTMSACCWFKLYNYDKTIMSMFNHLTNKGINFTVYSAALLRIFFGDGISAYGSGSYFYITKSISLDVWYHAAISYDGTNLKVYVNGELLSNTVRIIDFSNNEFCIGRWTASYNNYYVNEYIDDFRVYANALSDSEILSIYKERASIDNLGNFYVNTIQETKFKKPLINYDNWVVGSVGSQTGFTQNGTDPENSIIEDYDPWGHLTKVWRAYNNDVTSGADGGWVTLGFTIDPTKLYKYSLFVKRCVTGNGSYYFGTAGNVKFLHTSADNTNPYFWAGGLNQSYGWLLHIGYIFPWNTTEINRSGHFDSGVWYVDSKTKLVNNTDNFKFKDATITYSTHRSYLYYSTLPETDQRWCYPRVDLVDGTEPSFEELINGFTSLNDNYFKNMDKTKSIPFTVNDNRIYVNQYSEVGITNGLIAYYKLDNNSNDSSGNNRHGTANSVTYTSGINGNAGLFNGTSAYINIGQQITNPTQGSLSVWVKVNAWTTDFQTVFTDQEGPAWANTRHLLAARTGSQVISYIISNGTNYVSTCNSSVLTLGEWYHICGTYDGNNVKIYTNGVLSTNITTSTVPGTYTSTATQIGFMNYSTRYWDGLIDELRIYNRALSAEEVKLMYDLYNPNSTNRLIQNFDYGVYTKGVLNEV